MLGSNSLERNLQISGMILIFGLVVEALCLLGRGPISFLVFIAYYVLALVRSGGVGA